MTSNVTLLNTFIFVEVVQTSGQACRFLGYQVDVDPSSFILFKLYDLRRVLLLSDFVSSSGKWKYHHLLENL